MSNDPVTFPVECGTAPKKPTPPTDEIGGATVAVKCITGHGDLSWKIGSSTFTVGEVTGDDTTDIPAPSPSRLKYTLMRSIAIRKRMA